jgi:hypothetical protein
LLKPSIPVVFGGFISVIPKEIRIFKDGMMIPNRELTLLEWLS